MQRRDRARALIRLDGDRRWPPAREVATRPSDRALGVLIPPGLVIPIGEAEFARYVCIPPPNPAREIRAKRSESFQNGGYRPFCRTHFPHGGPRFPREQFFAH